MRITGNGLRISGNGLRFAGIVTPTLFTPTGTPTSLGDGNALFEMGVWNPADPANVVDISGQNHSMGFNDQTYSGNVNYAHFFNNSAQANDWNWPAADINGMTIMGWFAFASLTGNVSLVTRNEGSNGWALRIDSNGSVVNLVKYNNADQTINLNTPLTLNTWHFISVTQFYDSLIFVVDNDVYTITGSATPFADSGGPVRLQYDPYNGGNQNTEMWMRDVKIIQSNYSSIQLQNIYNAQKANYGY